MGKGIPGQSSGRVSPRREAAPGVCLWGASSEIVLVVKNMVHRKWNEQIWLLGTRERGEWCWANTCLFFSPLDALQGSLHQLCSRMQLWGGDQTVSQSFEMQISRGRASRDPARVLGGFSSALNTCFFHLKKELKKAKRAAGEPSLCKSSCSVQKWAKLMQILVWFARIWVIYSHFLLFAQCFCPKLVILLFKSEAVISCFSVTLWGGSSAGAELHSEAGELSPRFTSRRQVNAPLRKRRNKFWSEKDNTSARKVSGCPWGETTQRSQVQSAPEM